ncbi:MAG: DUF4012 domain-containing protein [bacterium]|nr:DUF4012 domain-containing protein [bacterium]
MFHLSRSKHINFSKLYRPADSLIGRIPLIKRRRRIRRVFKILKSGALAGGILLALLLALLSAQIFALKKIYDQAAAGKDNLEQAVNLSKKNDFAAAAIASRAAADDFSSSLAELNRFKKNYLINNFPWALSQLNEAESLLAGARFLSGAVSGSAAFGQNLQALRSAGKKLNFSNLSPEEKRKILSKIFQSAPELNGVKANLDLAWMNLSQIKARGWLAPFRSRLKQVDQQISQARSILAQAVPLAQLIPALAGYPDQAAFLVMLENNDELRPSGGFLGTYGILQTKDGDITDFYTDDIYHLDMPAQSRMNIEPPPPIKKYLNSKWYLRDANWSPDWPASARRIEWFYQTESGLNPQARKISGFNGVVALTPKLITDFLAVTGPLVIEGQTYDKFNFQDLLQYRVEKGYQRLGVSSWQRKQVIGEIAKELKKKIFALSAGQLPLIMEALSASLLSKDLQLYFTDPQLEKIAVDSGWAGEIKNYSGDYLMAVDANLGALKTDAVMSRGLEYEVVQGSNGLFSRLALSYANNGREDWKTTAYKSYTRIFVPLGSELIGISGYAPGQIDSGREAGKTWFGFYLTVAPGKINRLTVKYKLPVSIFSAGGYSLYLQKQAGKEIGQVKVDLNFAHDIKSYSPNSLSMQKISPDRLRWEGDLGIDRSFEIKF